MSVYHGDWDNWKDVQDGFSMKADKPDRVLYAAYDCEGYEGSADVVFIKDGKIGWASGSHCSCYGLEDQWDPEMYEPEEFLKAIERVYYGRLKDQIKRLQRMTKALIRKQAAAKVAA